MNDADACVWGHDKLATWHLASETFPPLQNKNDGNGKALILKVLVYFWHGHGMLATRRGEKEEKLGDSCWLQTATRLRLQNCGCGRNRITEILVESWLFDTHIRARCNHSLRIVQ